MTQFTVGCDPEFFIQPLEKEEKQAKISYDDLLAGRVPAPAKVYKGSKKDKQYEVFPICGLLGGTKEAPLAILKDKHGEGYAVQEDGIAAEFNIPACSTPRNFGQAIANALDHIERQMLRPKGFQRSYINSLTLKDEWTKKFPNILTVGCDPDYNAHEPDAEGYPVARIAAQEKVGLVRGAGGHVHVGYPLEMCPPPIMAKLLDIVLALYYVREDKQGERRKWWGHAGLYRPKSYGVEYRTLSNFWIWSYSKATELACRVFALCESLPTNMIGWQACFNAVDWKQVRDVIYREDAETATTLFARYTDMFPVLYKLNEQANAKLYEARMPEPIDPAPWRAGQLQNRARVPAPEQAQGFRVDNNEWVRVDNVDVPLIPQGVRNE